MEFRFRKVHGVKQRWSDRKCGDKNPILSQLRVFENVASRLGRRDSDYVFTRSGEGRVVVVIMYGQ